MRAVAGFVVVSALLLAGCSDAGPGSDVATSAPSEPAPVVQRFEATYDLVATDVYARGQHFSWLESSNCLVFDDHATLVAGSAEVHWLALPAPEMQLVFWLGEERHASEPGQGITTLDLAGFEVAANDTDSPLSWQMADEMAGGAVAELEGTLSISFDYVLGDGERAMDPQTGWTCAV